LNDTGLNDTGLNDTGLNDTGLNDTGLNDTGLNDTGLNDTGLKKTVSFDSIVTVYSYSYKPARWSNLAHRAKQIAKFISGE